MNKVKKNKLSKAIFLMQKAAQMYPKELGSAPQKQLLEVTGIIFFGTIPQILWNVTFKTD